MQTTTFLHVHKLQKERFIYARNHQKLYLYCSSHYLPDKRSRVWLHADSRRSRCTAPYCFPCAPNLAQIHSPCHSRCTLPLLFHDLVSAIMDEASTNSNTTDIALWHEVACRY